ncbi:hypothetical protein PROPHIGD91-3_56 [Mycobacterium phage prophi91-3]|nr:hypothetical protein PROPHIGD91-3_56 [Mycobacterium phage prophi91-3]
MIAGADRERGAFGLTVTPSIGMTAAFPVMPPSTTAYAAAGTYTYTIPYWCNKIDVVLVGGGKGGGGGWAGGVTGGGGNAGAWATITLVRGVDIPWTTSTITIIIPAAAAGGTSGNKGANGGTVTASATGWTAGLSAVGGTADQFGTTQTGQSPGTQNFNTQPYPGGAAQPSASGNGNAPGGGGAGGNGGIFSGNTGGLGGVGGAWCRAYQ